ncbi:probable protein S-acyltransferase 22 [Pyrus x bretschneideri]|uniref:probable protein S-acyltransferase 22 n=1 Tax=Pyrus x bretschneideri TaxID=225117 RepID=UPI00202F42AE|nr:probable protein S-acyltransferase 22 [Pyrus x bretschneideri]
MRKHGWQLPYHPLQVVAVAVFLALAFAFYVFFAPFVGRKIFQYIVMGLYTPLITCVFGLYIWCAAADPADPRVFRSKKYLNIPADEKHTRTKDSKLCGESTSSMNDANAAGGKPLDKDVLGKDGTSKMSSSDGGKSPSEHTSCFLLACSPCAYVCNCSGSSEESLQQSEDGMFYCSLCEVEVYKYSKHCRVCDKCVDQFDHHCRWLNNCIGKRNYRQFFTLMVTSLLLLILQWSTGIFVLICCIIERKQFSVDISSKLGSSFTLVPFIIVVAVCSLLAMVATLPLVQLFFFHILLIKKGISTYDYIIALREQEQEQQGVGGQQSAQMSPASSLTGLSSASSFNTFHHGAWCTPPRLFLEDQFDVVPPETGSVSSYGKKMVGEGPVKKKNAPVKISPWTLARLNAEEVSKAAAEARKKSKILQPVRRDAAFVLERDSSFGSGGRRMVPRPDNNRRRATKRVRLPADLPMEAITKGSAKAVDKGFTETSTSLAPLQLEARSAFQTSRAMSSSTGIVASSPESSLDSPDIHPFRVSSSGAEEARRLTGLPGAIAAGQREIPLSRSTSDGYEGYEASGGEDSDRVPTRIVQRSTNWSNLLFGSDQDERVVKLNASSSTGPANTRRH